MQMMFSSNRKAAGHTIIKVLSGKRNLNVRKETEAIYINRHKGLDFLRDPKLNKGLAYTIKERMALSIHGLLAAGVTTQKEQLNLCRFFVDRFKNPLNKYAYLADLHDENERLFYNLLATDIQKYMPIVYTPTVGLACQKFGLIYRRPRGLFITINDKGHIADVLRNWPEDDILAICFTDGERILGLGDLGAFGMGIPIGKLALYTVLAGIKPHQLLPITLDVGTDNEQLLQNPLYIGLRRKRARGHEYLEFMDEFVCAVTSRFGHQVLLQFEDFAYINAEPLLRRYRAKFTTFNDDIQGTAAVAVAGLYTAFRITKKKMSENIFMFLGAGSAATGIARLTVLAMMEEDLSEKEANNRIFMFDVQGLVTKQRDGGVPKLAKNYGKDLPPEKNFEKCVANIKPTCLIGCSTVGGSFTPAILKIMAANNERPVVFALSNPTSRAECTAQQAYDNTQGRVIFASGSPFPPVNYGGRVYVTGQGNNSYIFPGLALGVVLAKPTTIPDSSFLVTAKTLAQLVKSADLDLGRIYPPLGDIKNVSVIIAEEVMKDCYKKKIATLHPRPKDLGMYIRESLYKLEYPDYCPVTYDFPVSTDVKLKSIDEVYKSEIPK